MDEDECPFALGDLVLAKLSDYPYWPAKIQTCFQKNHYGKWLKPKNRTRPVYLWCYFVDEDSANWVAINKVKAFSRKEALNCLDEDSTMYDLQKAAIYSAIAEFEDASGKGRKSGDETEDEGNSPDRPEEKSDLQDSERKDDMDTDEKQNTESPKEQEGRRSKRFRDDIPEPKTAHEKSKTSSEAVDDGVPMEEDDHSPAKSSGKSASKASSGKKRGPKKRASLTQKAGTKQKMDESERELQKEVESLRFTISEKEREISSYTQQVKKLKKAVRERDRQIRDMKSDRVIVEVPSWPDHVPTEMPSPETHQSEDMSSEKFAEEVSKLRKSYEAFKSRLHEAKDLRSKFDEECKRCSDELEKKAKDISNIEQKALGEELAIIGVLKTLLVARVQFDDLRSQKAGKLVSRIGKSCQEMPFIKKLSGRISEVWKEQCLQRTAPSNSEIEEKGRKEEERVSKEEDETGNETSKSKSEKGPGSRGKDGAIKDEADKNTLKAKHETQSDLSDSKAVEQAPSGRVGVKKEGSDNKSSKIDAEDADPTEHSKKPSKERARNEESKASEVARKASKGSQGVSEPVNGQVMSNNPSEEKKCVSGTAENKSERRASSKRRAETPVDEGLDMKKLKAEEGGSTRPFVQESGGIKENGDMSQEKTEISPSKSDQPSSDGNQKLPGSGEDDPQRQSDFQNGQSVKRVKRVRMPRVIEQSIIPSKDPKGEGKGVTHSKSGVDRGQNLSSGSESEDEKPKDANGQSNEDSTNDEARHITSDHPLRQKGLGVKDLHNGGKPSASSLKSNTKLEN